jgi:hypothetical protein
MTNQIGTGEATAAMNRYGAMALAHMKTYLPDRYRHIADPQSYFRSVGDEATAQVDELQAVLAGTGPAEEDYLGRLRRETRAQREAEETVLAELVFLPPETAASQEEATTAVGGGGEAVREPPETAWVVPEEPWEAFERQLRDAGQDPATGKPLPR